MVAQESNHQIPMTILTGYLGAGKTTLINHILRSPHGLKIAVLVSDFSAVNIEEKFIVGIDETTMSLANGSLCCTVHDDLVTILDSLLKSDGPPDSILLEASGVTEPHDIIIDFNRSRLRSKIEIDSIVAILDAEQFRDVIGKPERLIYEQIEVADKVIINKVDLVNSAAIERAKTFVTRIAPKAEILTANYCNVSIPELLNVQTYNPQTAFDTSGPGIHVHKAEQVHEIPHGDFSVVFGTWDWQSDVPLALSEFRRVITQLPKLVFRAKGVVYLQEVPDRRVVLQLVGKHATLTLDKAWGDEQPYSQIVLIGEKEGIHHSNFQSMFESMRNTGSEDAEFVDGKMMWIRPR